MSAIFWLVVAILGILYVVGAIQAAVTKWLGRRRLGVVAIIPDELKELASTLSPRARERGQVLDISVPIQRQTP